MILRIIRLQTFALCCAQKRRIGSEKNKRRKFGELKLSVGGQSRRELDGIARAKRIIFKKASQFEQNRVGQFKNFVTAFDKYQKIIEKFQGISDFTANFVSVIFSFTRSRL